MTTQSFMLSSECHIFAKRSGSTDSAANAPVRFRFNQDKTVAAILYLAAKQIEVLDKYTLAKLLFLAEKFHLVRYGRPITGDEYYALPYGPVPSATLDLLRAEEEGKTTALTGLLGMDRSYANPRYSVANGAALELSVLSKSDLSALDLAVERHGSKTFAELKGMTHEMPAYIKAWSEKGATNRARMNFEDFFEEDSDAIEGTLELMLEDAELF